MQVEVADMKSYDGFYKRLVNGVPGLIDVTSSFAMEKSNTPPRCRCRSEKFTGRAAQRWYPALLKQKRDKSHKTLESNCVRLFAQIGWYFRREWRRYLGAVVLLIVIAILQLLPPAGRHHRGRRHRKQMSTGVLMAWLGLMIGTAIVVYLLRYVWRVLLFGASYQLAVELRENFTASSAGKTRRSTCATAPAI